MFCCNFPGLHRFCLVAPVAQNVKVDHHPGGGHWFAAGLSPNIPGRNRATLHNSPHFQVVPYAHASSYGSLGSHGSYNDGTGLGSSYGSYGDNSNMFAYYSPAGPSAMNIHAQGGVSMLGTSPDARRRIIHSHMEMDLVQVSTGSPGHYGPTSPARGSCHGSPLGKMAAGHFTDGTSSNQSEGNSQAFGGSPLHLQSNSNATSWKQQRGGSGIAFQNIPSSFTLGSNVQFAQTAGVVHEKPESSLLLPDPGDWDPNYRRLTIEVLNIELSDELLLQDDGSDMATEFSKGMHLGQNFGSAEPLVGVGRFGHASSTSSNTSRPIQPFSHAEVGSPPTHDPHAGYVRPMSKPSHFVPHISQNSPSRLGQQPIQRLNHGRSTAGRGSDWSQTKPSPPNFSSGGPRSPGNSSFSNGMSWGRRANHPVTNLPPTSYGRKDYGRIAKSNLVIQLYVAAGEKISTERTECLSHMMGTAAVIGLSAGNRLLASSHHYSDVAEKLSSYVNDVGFPHHPSPPPKNLISAKKPSNYTPSSNRSIQSMKALKEHVESASAPSTADPDLSSSSSEVEDEEYLVEAFLLLQKSMLEKQWNLSFVGTVVGKEEERRRRRKRRRIWGRKQGRRGGKSHVLGHRPGRGGLVGVVSEELLTHAQVVLLSNKIKAGLLLEDHKSRLKERIGSEPTDEQVAASLRMSRAELQSKLIECSLAREKLAMSNVRLVMSIAQRYDNMGAEMADLVQGGLIGLLRGIEKFDSSKGFKISTYVYWWIRSISENSRTLRLPSHLHERLSLIRNAKIRLEEKGITPSIDRIAECLNMSQKKVRNATEAISKVFSLDREAFPSLNGLPGETLHSYIADVRLENNPWHGVDEWALKDEVNKLINTTLGERERDIIRLYYGLDNECLTWEDISKRSFDNGMCQLFSIGLSRERVRQVGLVALEKLKNAARKGRMEAMLVKY
ncbi:RNA polymerase sigma factor sigA [Vitis vinifera]|uniref:RNA polymerase sigma factor sigA n=1 Tax=Vitis vinifera TaxID=29760 RepID=A0A438G4Q8_VITVI|nr:RNA polymerase sigma factor sigA [Vitis vinifera]